MKNTVTKLLDIKYVIILFIFLSLVHIEKPGLYIDSANPEYIGLHIFHPENVYSWTYSDNIIASILEGQEQYSRFPTLLSLYGSCFMAYTMMLWAIPFGYGVVAVRTSHIVYAVILLLALYSILKYITGSKKRSSLMCLLFAIEPSLIFNSRTQYYIPLFPHMFFLFGFLLMVKSAMEENNQKRDSFLGALLLGLGADSYFIFAFYSAVVLAIYCYSYIKGGGRKQSVLTSLGGFCLGCIPYLYGHISIILTQGFSAWVTALKGLDTYGISDGAKTSVSERLLHMVDRIEKIAGGSDVILQMTGTSIGNLYGRLFAFIFVLSVAVSVIILFRKRAEIKTSKCLYVLLMLDCIFICHCILAFIIGTSLGYQHFIMLLPIMYMVICLTAIEVFKYAHMLPRDAYVLVVKTISVITVTVIIGTSLFKVYRGYHEIKTTGGISYYSEAINDLSYYLNSVTDDADTVISPQWGYWMQIACITNGEIPVWVDTDKQTLQWRMDNNVNSGSYYVVIDNRTDTEMINSLMEENGYVITDKVNFHDYNALLMPAIWKYSYETNHLD